MLIRDWNWTDYWLQGPIWRDWEEKEESIRIKITNLKEACWKDLRKGEAKTSKLNKQFKLLVNDLKNIRVGKAKERVVARLN